MPNVSTDKEGKKANHVWLKRRRGFNLSQKRSPRKQRKKTGAKVIFALSKERKVLAPRAPSRKEKKNERRRARKRGKREEGKIPYLSYSWKKGLPHRVIADKAWQKMVRKGKGGEGT